MATIPIVLYYKIGLLVLMVLSSSQVGELSLGSQNYQSVTLEEIEQYGNLMLQKYGESLENVRDERFSRYACSSNVDQPIREPGSFEFCDDIWAVTFLPYCAPLKAYKGHLSHCGQALKQDMESLESIYCLVALSTRELVWKVVMEMFEDGCEDWSRMSTEDLLNWCYSSTADHYPYFFLKGRHFVDKFQLKTKPNVTSICSKYSRGDVNGVDHPRIVFSQLLFHTAATLKYKHGKYGLPPVSEMCWEPTLQSPNSLYHKPGRWNVSMECVTLLQTLATAMYANMSERQLASARRYLTKTVKNIVAQYPANSRFRLWYPALWRYFLEVETVLFETPDPVNQLWLYPIFRRFKTTALLRRYSMDKVTSAVVVLCAGLQGTREDVVSSVIQLLRLVIVNDLHVLPYWREELGSVFAFNHYLSCLAEDAI